MSALDSAEVRREASSLEQRPLHLRPGPLVGITLALALVVAVVLFLVLRAGEDRRSFTFRHVYGHLVFGHQSTRRFPNVGSVQAINGPRTLRAAGLASTETPVSATAAQKTERIAGSDATIARLVRLGDGRRVGPVALWSLWGSPGGGAVLFYVLRRPVAVNSDVPYVQLPVNAASCSKPYAAGWAHLRASGVTVLQVLVDLRRARVVQISTNANRGRVSPVEGKPYPTCSDSGPSG